jgi:hypothetical protein
MQLGSAIATGLDIELPDEALLPLPPDGAPWPTGQTADLVAQRVAAYPSTPHLAPRLISVLVRFGWHGWPVGFRNLVVASELRFQGRPSDRHAARSYS